MLGFFRFFDEVVRLPGALFGVCLGGCIGIDDVVVAVGFAAVFGEKHIGSINGVVAGFMTACTGQALLINTS